MRRRPPSSGLGARPPAGMRLGTGQVPGTGRPGTRSGQPGAPSTILPAGISVADRPMTQQGLGGMKTANKGPQRQIQDHSYWLGEIRTKSNELATEIRKVEGDIRQYQEENNTYLMFEKRAETSAAEISALQGELHDYNTMIDRINMNQEISTMNEELNALRSRNDRDNESLERIFEQKQSLEQQTANLESEIHREKALTENRVQDMNPDMQRKYAALKSESLDNMELVNRMQEEIESMNSKQQQIEQSLQASPMKMEAVRLYDQKSELMEKYEQLRHEQKKFSSPEDEKEELLAKVKSDNQEIATMERQTKEMDTRMIQCQEELQQIETAIEDQQGESSEKYRQLQKREQSMDEFMESFDKNAAAEMEQLQQLKQSNVALLEAFSRDILSGSNLPSVDEVRAMQEDLVFKEGELQKSEATSNTLAGDNVRLQQDLTKVEQLAEKIGSEIINVREQNVEMKRDLKKFSDIDQLHVDSEQKKRELLDERAQLEKRKEQFRATLDDMTAKYEKLKAKLEENETHAQLVNQEKKWQHLEQSNFALSEFIKSRSLDYKPVAIKVDKKLNELNKKLQDFYTKGSIM